MPTKDAIEALRRGSYEPPREPRPPLLADEQVRTEARLAHVMQYFADHGEGPEENSINYLTPGIFEFKAGRGRIAFFDTDGSGAHTPKRKYESTGASPYYPDSPTWEVPDLDEHIRLCNFWVKDGQTTEPQHIHAAKEIQKEDLSHGR